VRVRVDGGIKTGRDVVVAALLGADEVSFGTALLLAEGCLLVRSCHLDTCPVGIATQRPELRAKFDATPEQVEAYLRFVAEEVREHLAALGVRRFEDAVGRSDMLRPRGDGVLDAAAVLAASGGGYAGERQPVADGGSLGERLAQDAAPAVEEARIVELSYEISNGDRAVGARLGGTIGGGRTAGRVRATFTGSAGQSFGAFLASGVRLTLVGEANDYVGKSMSAGRISIRPPDDDAGNPVLLGNAALYGATGGQLFAAASAGERFAVRNSGATAVVEGAGAHLCEYMTGGLVVVLGEVGRNVGAGMSGGELVVLDLNETLERRLDGVHAIQTPDLVQLHELIQKHVRETDSARAKELLDTWTRTAAAFRLIAPQAAGEAVRAASPA
jgi:glutamate synthase (ferredoxin)